MFKHAKKITLLILAAVMMLAMSVTAYAAPVATGQLKSITLGKSITLYTNGDDTVYYDTSKTPKATTFPQVGKISVKMVNKNDSLPGSVIATSADRSIAEAVFDGTDVVVTAKANGKVKITVADALNSKLKKTVTVTVKTLAKDITSPATVTVAEGGSVFLGAAVSTPNATSPKLTYLKTVDAKVATVSNGKVSGKKAAAGKTTTFKVQSKEGKYIIAEKEVTVNVEEVSVKSIGLVGDTSLVVNAKKPTSGKITLYGNANHKQHTYDVLPMVTAMPGKTAGLADLSYTSSKPSVATVSADGVITAVGSGKATITVAPKTGNSAKATIAVTVTTNADKLIIPSGSLNVLAGKKIGINASVNKDADKKNQAITYSVVNVMEGTDPIESKDFKKFVTVDAKGNVTGKKLCTAEIRVSVKSDASLNGTVSVKVSDPVNSVVLTGENGEKSGKLVIDSGNQKETAFLKVAAKTKLGLSDVNADALTYTSSNPAVVSIGNVTADSVELMTDKDSKAATVTITAAANDGSGKKATFKVKVNKLAYEINVPGLQTVSGQETLYIDADAKKKTKIDAAVNADASNKKVTYAGATVNAKGEISLADSETEEVTITSGDGKVSKTIQVVGVGEANQATEFEVKIAAAEGSREFDNDVATAYKGDKLTFTASVTAKDGKKVVDDSVAWTAMAQDKDGNYTRKVTINAKGQLTAGTLTTSQAPIRVTAAKGEASSTIDLYVGNSYADVKKEIDNLAAATLKEENRDWMGGKASFNAKASAFTLEILDANKKVRELKNTGLADLADRLADASYKQVSITNDGITLNLIRNGSSVDVKVGDQLLGNAKNMNEAMRLVRDNMGQYGISKDAALGELVGRHFDIVLTRTDKSSPVVVYSIPYTLDVTTNSKYYMQAIDERIAKAVETVNADVRLEQVGLAGVDYNADTTTATIEFTDGSKKIKDVLGQGQPAREVMVEQLSAIFADASEAEVRVNVAGIPERKVKRTDYNTTEDAINNILDTMIDRLEGKKITEFGMLNDAVASAYVTFDVNGLQYNGTYSIHFYQKRVGKDEAVDEKIKAFIEQYKKDHTDLGFGDMEYDADTNVLSFEFAEKSALNSVLSFKDTAVIGALDTMISSEGVTDATVVNVDGKSNSYAGEELKASKLGEDLIGDAVYLKDLDRSQAIIKVVYGEEATIKYTVAFTCEDIDVSEKENAVDSALAQNYNFAKDFSFGLADYTVDTKTLDVEIRNDQLSEKVDDLEAEIENMITMLTSQNFVNGLTVKNIAKKSQTFDVTEADFAAKAAEYLVGAKTKNLSALAEKTASITVSYGYNEETAAEFTYTIEIDKQYVSGNSVDLDVVLPVPTEETDTEETDVTEATETTEETDVTETTETTEETDVTETTETMEETDTSVTTESEEDTTEAVESEGNVEGETEETVETEPSDTVKESEAVVSEEGTETAEVAE